MRRSLTALLVVGLVSFTSRDAAAQPSEKDYAAYAALSATPVGALAPMVVSLGASTSSFAFNVSHFSPKSGDGDNTIGASYYRKAGSNAVLSGTVGYTQVGCPSGATCDNTIMLGGDVHSRLWDNAAAKSTTNMSINLQGSLGYGKNGDDNVLSAAIGVPLAISMEQASKARFGAFVRPGFGFGRLSVDVAGTSTSESGTRPYVGAGLSWAAPAGWGLHAAYNKVIIEDGGNSFGVGFNWNMK
jgi:outer membrane protein with beta-barrel domain